MALLVAGLLVVGVIALAVFLVRYRPPPPELSWDENVIQLVTDGRMLEIALPEVVELRAHEGGLVFRGPQGDALLHAAFITPELRAAIDTACGVATTESSGEPEAHTLFSRRASSRCRLLRCV